MWNQIYDPLNNWFFSTLLVALPTFVLLGAFFEGAAGSGTPVAITAAYFKP